MAVHEQPHRHTGFRFPSLRRTRSAQAPGEAVTTSATVVGSYALAGLRLLTGFVFLWAFLDKAFGFGYATPSGKGWIDGGSPTKGFLGGVAAGPMESTFHSWAGAGWVDWLFMAGLLGVGIALVAGVALRLAAVAGTVMMVFMWLAEWPPARHLSDGSPSMSPNPFTDYHVIYAVVLIVLAAAGAGATWGLGKLWARLPVVNRTPWLR
ncbi:DoxX family membrane protein [Streptomyces rhizosphaerihabitans]|uniref:DoxX family membrane protein n=1 Tax=Streptomyces rhizosphaerihabitans TaxID=1266770 RepID=UPI0021C1CA3A|nr:DoxX family membrane protein [Streptomyces rhizosphaerihabitans]MCT9011092.1 DoxX family membrane protein [Streptomyces rhizosphaerihabitans]